MIIQLAQCLKIIFSSMDHLEVNLRKQLRLSFQNFTLRDTNLEPRVMLFLACLEITFETLNMLKHKKSVRILIQTIVFLGVVIFSQT